MAPASTAWAWRPSRRARSSRTCSSIASIRSMRSRRRWRDRRSEVGRDQRCSCTSTAGSNGDASGTSGRVMASHHAEEAWLMGVAHYFERVREATGSRFWVNNPTGRGDRPGPASRGDGLHDQPRRTEATWCGALLKRSCPSSRECLRESEDDEVVADLVQRRLVGRICERFMPLYERSGGREGFVSIQGAPEADHDACGHPRGGSRRPGHRAQRHSQDLRRPRRDSKPSRRSSPRARQVIVTEVFSVAQVIETCDRWLAVTERTGVRPPFMMSPITGIFGDHLKKRAARD